MRSLGRVAFWSLCTVGAISSCAPTDVENRLQAVSARCEAEVIGTGSVDVENDYLPRVVNCENGAADFEALKAQAIAARSFLYYRLEVSGDIEDGTNDQVYTCGREPGPQHQRAVDETSGLILRYRDVQVAAFYVAGALQAPPDCTGGTMDDTDTEVFVTYNDGLAGDNITQTTLGFVDPSNFANRGCMSQNGSHCLSMLGRDAESIVRFYYGADIELERAEGPCVNPTGADAGPETPMGDPDTGCGCSSGSGGGLWIALVFVALGLIRSRRATAALLMIAACSGEPPNEPAPAGACLGETDDGMALVAGGDATLGCDPMLYDCERWMLTIAPYVASVAPFAIDKHEVTRGEYDACVAAQACGAPFNGPQPAGEPVHLIPHEAAIAFCAWAGKRLPTWNEWELAAREAGRSLHPWGELPATCDHANSSECGGALRPPGATPAGATSCGVHDMAGNVAEYTSDDPANAPDIGDVLLYFFRGGGIERPALDSAAFAIYGDEDGPYVGMVGVGFRCARGVAAP